MIVLFRIDYRLLHFQTASVWPNKIGADTIIIANDAVVRDQMQIGLIKMIAPKGIKLRICSLEKAIVYLNSPESKDRRIELLVSSTDDCVKITEEVDGIHEVCAGLMKSEEGKKIVSKTLAIGPSDERAFRRLLELGVKVQSYSTPDDVAVPIEKYLNG